MDGWNLTTTEGDLPEDVQAVYFTSNAFNFFWRAHAAGRGLLPSDAPEGQDPENVAVLGYQFWQRHYNGDPVLSARNPTGSQELRDRGCSRPRFTWGDAEVYLPLSSRPIPCALFSS